ncbi:hypothetical protein PF006_g3845 [Phytophthora fragariae]|uniref:Uncharacterized protein n=1 Tax=Phytophthora fragariae TaxID=53985 RepID=A0A6A3LWL6_9STRA|nr:hypothetical protein PF003_g23362 [Phytophthora fragariae]KAE9024141.1 hypothetical protein PF011_g3650 [Phytophthora fragariae]KAE9151905.1 hypothetical protein PF006_g3845 [Phytophthora fragariae]
MAGDSEAVDGALVDLSARPTTQMLLAVHHDRYTQLLRAFLAWKRRAQAQRVRRKRIATACRVGSVFCQRIYWTRWREFAAERQQQRQNDEIKDLEQEEKEEEEEKLRSMEEAANNVGITQVTDTIVSKSDEEGDSSDQSAAALMTKRHYIKRWKRRVEQEKKNAAISTNVVVRIRSLHAIRRWRGICGKPIEIMMRL